MFIKNNKPIKIVGFPESSMTQEYLEVFAKDGLKELSVVTPDNFTKLQNKKQYQYIIAFGLDINERRHICDILDDQDLDCLTYINDDAYIFPSAKIGKGCFIGHQCIVSWDCIIGDHCYMTMTSAIAHHVSMGKNCLLYPRVEISGKTKIGENCRFLIKSSVLSNLTICDNVTLSSFSNLTRDVTIPGTYTGTSARLMKKSLTDQDL